MSDYTPSTEEVRECVGDRFCLDPDGPHAHGCPADAMFDRWLAAHDRAVLEAARLTESEIRRDQAEVDTRIAESEGHLWSGAGATANFRTAEKIRAQQFTTTPEGGTDEH